MIVCIIVRKEEYRVKKSNYLVGVIVLVLCSGCASISTTHYTSKEEAIAQEKQNGDIIVPTFPETRTEILQFLNTNRSLIKAKQESYVTLSYKSKDHFKVFVSIVAQSDNIQNIRLTSTSTTNIKEMVTLEDGLLAFLKADTHSYDTWFAGINIHKNGYHRYNEKQIEVGFNKDNDGITMITKPRGGVI